MLDHQAEIQPLILPWQFNLLLIFFFLIHVCNHPPSKKDSLVFWLRLFGYSAFQLRHIQFVQSLQQSYYWWFSLGPLSRHWLTVSSHTVLVEACELKLAGNNLHLNIMRERLGSFGKEQVITDPMWTDLWTSSLSKRPWPWLSAGILHADSPCSLFLAASEG